MEREISRLISSPETKDNLNGRRVLVYRYANDEEGQFRTSIIKKGSDDKISSYVSQEIENVVSHIKNSRREIREYSNKKRHGQQISVSQVRQVREQKERDVNVMARKLKILEGREIHPIVLEKDNDEITGSNLSLSPREAHWWSYLKQNPDLFELPSEDFQFTTRAYFARFDIKSNSEGAKERYYGLLKELRDEREHLTDIVADITKHLTS